MLVPKLEILPPAQQRLWPELEAVPDRFVLYGGTALALRVGHRVSQDFDFFSSFPFEPSALEREIPLLAAGNRLQSAANTLTVVVDRDGPVKLSFFGGLSLRRVADPERVTGPRLWVASLLDLSATKVAVLQERAEAKDYLDMDRLLIEGLSLEDALGAARAVFGPRFNPLLTLKALSYFEDGDLSTLPAVIRERLSAAARGLDPMSIPEVSAQGAGLVPEIGGPCQGN